MDGILGNGRRAPAASAQTIVALNDLEQIRRYIAEENPAAGARITAMIRNAVEQLTDHPNLGRSGRVEGTRELVIADTPYIVAYRVLNNRLRILSVIHGARRWPERF
jgi:toxin ParE1/3/4